MTGKRGDDLLRIRGVGKILAQRLSESGYSSFKKLAAAEVEQLAALPGLNRPAAERIVEQARRLRQGDREGASKVLAELLPVCERMMDEIQGLAMNLEKKLAESSTRSRRKLEKETEKLVEALRQVKTALLSDMSQFGKKTAKKLGKAGETLAGLDLEQGSDVLKSRLKKARRKVRKILE